jgi:nucleoside-diphosphate-sugar epimerase
VRRLVFVSSVAAVHCPGEPVVTPRSDCEPRDPYGLSKRRAEEAVRRVLGPAARADWTILRPPLVYGPGSPGNMARLLRLVDTGLPLPFGGVASRRSFLYAGNLVDAIERCMTAVAASRRSYLVADAEVVSTADLLRRMALLRGRTPRLFRAPAALLWMAAATGETVGRLLRRPVGIDRYSLEKLVGSLEVDASEITRELGWRPPFTLTQGLERTFGAAARGGAG